MTFDLSEVLEKHIEKQKQKWEKVKEKLGITSELIVIDYVFREGEFSRSIHLLGSDTKIVWNPIPEFVEQLADSTPCGIVINSPDDYRIEAIDHETLKNLATAQEFDLPFVVLNGVVKISAKGKLYFEVGERRYFFASTQNSKKLERILRKNRIKELPVELVALILENEEGGQIYAFTADWEKVIEQAKTKRQEIEQLLELGDVTIPNNPLRWANLPEEARLDFAKHYLKLAAIYEGRPLVLLDESLPHHPKAFVAFKPEGKRKYSLNFNVAIIKDFLELLGFDDYERPILAQDLERAIRTKFPQLEEALDELLIEAIKPYLAPGQQKFDPDEGVLKVVGEMRIPECIETMLYNIDQLQEEHIQLLASYIKFYSKGLPIVPPEDRLRKGEKIDKRLALWEWIVKRLGGNNLWLLATFKKYYEKAAPPFICPRKQGKDCLLLDLKGQLPKCPFIAWKDKVERYIAMIDKVEIQAPDAIVVYFGNNKPKVLEGVDVENRKIIEEFRGWLIATFGEEFTKAQAYQILKGLVDRAHIVESEFSEEADIAELFANWLAEVARKGVYPWEARNAKSLFFDPTKQSIYIPNPLLITFLAITGRQTKKGIKRPLKQELKHYLITLDKQLPSPIPEGPNSQTMVRPRVMIIKRQYLEKELGIELKEKELVEEVTEELPPEEGDEE